MPTLTDYSCTLLGEYELYSQRCTTHVSLPIKSSWRVLKWPKALSKLLPKALKILTRIFKNESSEPTEVDTTREACSITTGRAARALVGLLAVWFCSSARSAYVVVACAPVLRCRHSTLARSCPRSGARRVPSEPPASRAQGRRSHGIAAAALSPGCRAPLADADRSTQSATLHWRSHQTLDPLGSSWDATRPPLVSCRVPLPE